MHVSYMLFDQDENQQLFLFVCRKTISNQKLKFSIPPDVVERDVAPKVHIESAFPHRDYDADEPTSDHIRFGFHPFFFVGAHQMSSFFTLQLLYYHEKAFRSQQLHFAVLINYYIFTRFIYKFSIDSNFSARIQLNSNKQKISCINHINFLNPFIVSFCLLEYFNSNDARMHSDLFM